ncbi:MAG: 2-amino-4-hydroxy-6-hydroxymethyldihydropteridine diphosphokinase [Gammaproteobacteria bacterium]|nr:MAG: 2-amino-4-hydroxy-6-hydroxymethyldihydropteridine diphosphokinase [Gammaproteobacteria bacterium]
MTVDTTDTADAVTVFVGLGANLGDRLATLRRALTAIAAIPGTQHLAVSPVYETRPMGPADQPDYANAVCRFETSLQPLALLDALQAIENAAGRDRSVGRWRERSLDLDLLLYGDQEIQHERLTVPHAGLVERSFVRVPLADLEPELEIPGKGPLAGLPEVGIDYQLGFLGNISPD